MKNFILKRVKVFTPFLDRVQKKLLFCYIKDRDFVFLHFLCFLLRKEVWNFVLTVWILNFQDPQFIKKTKRKLASFEPLHLARLFWECYILLLHLKFRKSIAYMVFLYVVNSPQKKRCKRYFLKRKQSVLILFCKVQKWLCFSLQTL